jgi:hypothetical protein
MRYTYLLCLFFLPLFALAQNSITGKVINLYDKKPIANASIFLSNTTVGATTTDDGSYNLTNVKPGQYDMVVSAVGFETSHQTVMVNGNLTIPFTELEPKTISLKAVEVKPDRDWEQNYRIFKEEFFGDHPFARECRILNPEVINLTFDRKANALKGSSNDYIKIENNALGYTIEYFLSDFSRDFKNQFFYFQGNVLFRPMKGTDRQQKRWKRNRLNAFTGSTEHYLRSVLRMSTEPEGFKTLTLVRKPNPERPADSLIQAKLKQFRGKLFTGNAMVISSNDSVAYWSEKSRLPKMVDYLVTKPLRVDSLVKRTDQKGIYALGYQYILYVLYTKKSDDGSYTNRPLNAPNKLTSLMNIKDPYIFFDLNGVIINPTSVVYEGYWAKNRVAKLLPVDYEPDEKDK